MGEKLTTVVLIDAHAVLHRAYHALPEFTSPSGEPTGGLYGTAAFVLKMVKDIKPDYVIACYDLPGATFRHDSYKEYKAGRAKADDALVAQMQSSRTLYGALGIPIYDAPGFEADDMLGTIAEQLKGKGGIKVVIASGDMDTMQLVSDDKVVVYTLKKGLNDTVTYNEAAVTERYGFGPELLPDYKGLRGDPSDNIIGIAGIGEKTATELIKNFGPIEAMYTKLKKDPQAFLDAGIKPRIVELLKNGEEEAFFSKTLATIRRDAPITFVLPAARWEDGLDRGRVTEYFESLGFKSLLGRLPGAATAPVQKASAPVAATLDEASYDPDLIQRARIALWVLDSTKQEAAPAEILAYAKAGTLEEAYEKLLARLTEEKLLDIFERFELPLIPVLNAASERGIMIDRKYLAKLSKDYHTELARHEKKIYELAGKEFNINSPKQLGEVLYGDLALGGAKVGKTAGGAQSTNIAELEKMSGTHPIIDEIKKYRELQKLLSTYIDVLPGMADGAGRLHTRFDQTGTTTGRIASKDPNLQNIPIKSEAGERIRRAFIAAPGYKLLDLDYSQVELRALAMLSGEEHLIDIFKKGGDIHEAVARRVFKVPEGEAVSKEQRRRAKVINFGIIYGMGILALKKNLGTTREEAQQFYDDYFAEFPKVGAYMEATKEMARTRGYVETLFGRRRYFPNMRRLPPREKAAAERMAINAPCQGTNADINKIAMIEADKRLREAGLRDHAHLLLQVHDELIYEVREDKLEEVLPIVREAMVGVVRENPKARGVPLTVDASVGDNWSDAVSV